MLAELLNQGRSETPDGNVIGYTIAASKLYPAMLALVADPTAEPMLGDDESRQHYARLLKRARSTPGAIQDAAKAHAETLAWSAERRQARAEILELCRLWYTAELHATFPAEHRLALHITRDVIICDNCGGTGKVYAGKHEIICPACCGARQVKVDSPWRL